MLTIGGIHHYDAASLLSIKTIDFQQNSSIIILMK